jgi:hypothetical protein
VPLERKKSSSQETDGAWEKRVSAGYSDVRIWMSVICKMVLQTELYFLKRKKQLRGNFTPKQFKFTYVYTGLCWLLTQETSEYYEGKPQYYFHRTVSSLLVYFPIWESWSPKYKITSVPRLRYMWILLSLHTVIA